MDHLTPTPSRSFFRSTLYATAFSTAFLCGGICLGMEPSYDTPGMGPEEMIEMLIKTIPEDQHIGAYLESMEASDLRYKIIHASFEKELTRKNIIILKEWKEEAIFEMVNALGLRSPFLMPGLMQALKDNKNIRIMDVSGLTLTTIDEECISDILDVNKQITLTRNQDDLHKTKSLIEPSESQKTMMDEEAETSYLSLKLAMNSLERLNLHIWMTTPLMINARDRGITSPFFIPGFVRALRENKTIKIIDIRNYNLNKIDIEELIQVLAVKKNIKLIPDINLSEIITKGESTLKSTGKKYHKLDTPSTEKNTSTITLTEFLNDSSFPRGDDSLADLERSFENKEIDKETYETVYALLKNDLSPQRLSIPVERKIETINITNEVNTHRKSLLPTQEMETPIEEIIHSEGEKFKSKLKEDYESGEIDLITYNLWLGQVDKVKLEQHTTKEQILEKGALNIQSVFLETNNRKLNYQGVNVNEDFILDVLVRLIRMDTFLTHLNFNTCQIDDLGAIQLAEALKENKTIRHLNLSNNQIGPVGATAFANLFGSSCILERKPCLNDTLKTLRLEGNPISREMIEQISRRIKGSEFTKELDEDQKNAIYINIIEIPTEQVNETSEKLDA